MGFASFHSLLLRIDCDLKVPLESVLVMHDETSQVNTHISCMRIISLVFSSKLLQKISAQKCFDKKCVKEKMKCCLSSFIEFRHLEDGRSRYGCTRLVGAVA